jgi:hypothetical protein
MTDGSFVVGVTLLQRCIIHADSKEEAEDNIWLKSTRGSDFIAVSGEDPAVVNVSAKEWGDPKSQ